MDGMRSAILIIDDEMPDEPLTEEERESIKRWYNEVKPLFVDEKEDSIWKKL